MNDFRLRQVHLDFHTSGLIPGIGSRFDKTEWQNTLKLGHVESITVFAKCHHGWAYYPSEVNEMHPGLSFDLLKAQLDACAEINVKAPVYISAGLDEKDAVAHHEWIVRDIDDYNDPVDFDYPGYHLLCLNTPYLDKLCAEVEEVMRLYNPCEIFLDILSEHTCWCEKCRADMTAAGIDYSVEENVRRFGRKIYRNYLDRIYFSVRKYNPDTVIFHNSGHVSKGRRDLIDTMAHLELESLPTGGWGYDHFPMSAGYAYTQRENFLGMTGKFHGTWGEFGGFKHPNALRYEASLSLAMGGGCSVGDQMHPEGKLNESTFALIGAAYSEVEKKEPWCKGAKPLAEIGVLACECINGDRGGDAGFADNGANRILLETGRLYRFIDTEEDFTKYRLLILPDLWKITDTDLKNKLISYVNGGGKLLLSGVSGLDETDNFIFDTGVTYLGENSFCPTYFIPDFPTVNGTTEYLMREKAYRIENRDAEIVGLGQNPYFNRTPEHFCSHQHAPNDRSFTFPTAAVKGNIGYIAWNAFGGYGKFGDYHRKELIAFMIEKLLAGQYMIKTDLPDRGIQTVLSLGNSRIVHLLFAHTTKRGEKTEVIESIVPLYNRHVSVECARPTKITIVPDGKELAFTYENGHADFIVPEINIHTMISIE